MAIINRIGDFQDEMTAWRRDLHAHPEIGFDETRTAAVVADKLRSFGLDEVHTGLAKTGVVGVLKAAWAAAPSACAPTWTRCPSRRRPACPTPRPTRAGCTPAATTATPRCCSARPSTWPRDPHPDGTIYFIFQPAEEMAGGRVMVDDGLFERFPAEQVFGMHNWPRLPVGQFAMRPGLMMAAADRIEIWLTGRGGHGAMPHHACDPVVAGAQIVSALQDVARNADPIDHAVVSITQFHAGDADNVIPQTALLGGTARSFTPRCAT